ncbi:MAG: AMP-binding protein [Clostridia bacterium]|nr:AMP-binding protein [Clostridia bacterium]
MVNTDSYKERISISEAVLCEAQKSPERIAITYLGRKISYKTFMKKVNSISLALYSMGVKRGEVVLVALPNIPQAVYMLYSLNRIGAIPAFLSPLSAEYELEEYINKCKSEVIIALDSLYQKFMGVFKRTGVKKLVLTSVFDESGIIFKNKKDNALMWREFLKLKTDSNIYLSSPKPDDTAVILFSGGTTGKPKAVELTNLNLNALAEGTENVCGEEVRGVKMLSVLPVFHGFGLGICIHTVLYFGGECILVPRFDADKIGRIIRIHKPQYIASVPAMLSAFMKSKTLVKADFSKLRGVFSGGDSLSAEIEESFNKFLLKHKAQVKIRQGYGLTECVAASALMPAGCFKAGSVGKPYPHTLYKIVMKNTEEELPPGETGEICISGKTVMKGYFCDKEESDNTLKVHRDGKLWLHTGDMGYIDKDGFVFFKGRIKRIIVTNGYNVYPSELEKALLKHEAVKECCAVGISDKRKSQRAIMFAVIKEGIEESKEKQTELINHLRRFVSKQSMPANIYFIERIPRTQLGKVAYTELIKKAEVYRNEKNTAE